MACAWGWKAEDRAVPWSLIPPKADVAQGETILIITRRVDQPALRRNAAFDHASTAAHAQL